VDLVSTLWLLLADPIRQHLVAEDLFGIDSLTTTGDRSFNSELPAHEHDTAL
jgi:hypothetical protein